MICNACGWWASRENLLLFSSTGPATTLVTTATYGHLRNLDVGDQNAPIEEVRRYLNARYDARFEMHPRLFEETVASVFGDLGHKVRLTAYQKDGGIDVFLGQTEGQLIGVQVKRTRGPVEVSQIRELAGALVENGVTRGMFVTTSRFTAGAERAAGTVARRGYPIELIDAARFYDALGLSARPPSTHVDEVWSYVPAPPRRYEVERTDNPGVFSP